MQVVEGKQRGYQVLLHTCDVYSATSLYTKETLTEGKSDDRVHGLGDERIEA